MQDSTKILIALIIAFTIVVTAAIICDQSNNPTQMPEKLRQQICNEEGI